MSSATLVACLALACAGWVSADQTPPQQKAPELPTADREIRNAIEEFKVQTGNLGLRSDSPRRKGQSGTKAVWHGRIYNNLRNDFLDAVPHEVVQRGSDKSTLRRNQFGFNIAGPVIIPKIYDGRRTTFFSLSYEGVRERISRSYLRTIPTSPERTGDWSETVDQAGNFLPIYDPDTTRSNPNYDPAASISLDNLQYLRDPFPENRIPAKRLDSVAQRVLAYYPEPNTNVGPFFRNNYFVQANETNVANGMIAKLDHSLRERHRLSLGLSFSNGLQGTADLFPTAADPAGSDRQFSNRRISVEHVFTASARTLNTFGLAVSTNGSNSGTADETNYSELLGLGGRGPGVFPVFYFGRYVTLGRAYPTSKNGQAEFNGNDAFSFRRGKHALRISGSYTRYRVNTIWPAYPAGSFSFSSGLTSVPGIVDTGHPFASFLLGMSEYSTVSVVQSPSYFRRSAARIAFQDSYEAAKGLTFSIGLGLEGSTPRVERYNRQSTVDLDAINPANGRKGALIVAGHNGTPRAFQPVRVKLEPSASVAWNPRGATKTVLRGSFARSYSAIPVYSGQWGTQAFNGTLTYFSQNSQLEPALLLARGLPPAPRTFPDLRPEAANETVADLIDRSDRQPVYQAASVSLEREMPGSVVMTLAVGYAGGKDLLVGGAANPNAIHPEALKYRDQLNDESFNRSLRPYPQYFGFDLNGAWPSGQYRRDAASIRLEKRASQGLTVSAFYEWSKQFDDYSGPYGTQDYFNSKNEWSLTSYNNPHRLSFNAVYELPLGPNKSLLNYSDWRRHLLEGWSLSESTSFYSGEPIALRPQFNNTGGVISSLRVNVVPGVSPSVAEPGPDLWFNPAAFDQPPDFTMGNASRTHPTIRGPGNQNHDLSLTKRFAVATDRTVEFTAVGLNFLNHANWSEPDTLIGPASAPNVNAGKIIGSRGGRIIQLGLRFSF